MKLVCLLLIIIGTSQAQNMVRGVTKPIYESDVSSTVAGRISNIKYREGAFVKKGTIVIQLENEVENFEVKRRKLILESTAELKSAQLQEDASKRDYIATKEIFDSTQSISEEEVWKKELDYKLSISEAEKMKIAEDREQIEYNIAKAELNKRLIKAPFSGTIVSVHFNEGESCNALEPMFKIVDVRKVKFLTYIEAEKSHTMTKGASVNLSIDGGVTTINKVGKVRFISPVADAASGLREVHVVFDNADLKVKPGVSGTMSF